MENQKSQPSQTESAKEMQFEPRHFRHIDPTLPAVSDDEMLDIMREFSAWSLWDKLGWLEAAGKYLRAKGIVIDSSSPIGDWS